MSIIKRLFTFLRHLTEERDVTVSSLCVRFSMAANAEGVDLKTSNVVTKNDTSLEDTPCLQVVRQNGHYVALNNAKLQQLQQLERESCISGVRLDVVAAKRVPKQVLSAETATEIELVELTTPKPAQAGLYRSSNRVSMLLKTMVYLTFVLLVCSFF